MANRWADWGTTLGPNSAKITYPASASLTDLIDTIEAVITAAGRWTLYDAAAGTNARVYRRLAPDGVRYGYVEMNYNTAGKIFAKTWESWNSGTHTGTNLCSWCDSYEFARINLAAGGYVIVFVSALWLFGDSLYGTTKGNANGSWGGCFFFKPMHSEDNGASGYPVHGWTDGWFLTQYTSGSSFIFPRTRSGSPSGNNSVSATIWGLSGKPVGTAVTLYQNIPSLTDAWNGKYIAAPITVGQVSGVSPDMRGPVYGLLIIQRSAGTVNPPCTADAIVKMDTNYLFDPAGVDTQCWIIGGEANNTCCVIPK